MISVGSRPSASPVEILVAEDSVTNVAGSTSVVADNADRGARESEPPTSYQESARFCTWRKHVRDLYQQLFYVDLVWEAPAAQLMPYVTVKDDIATHTIVCGTRTGGQEQSFIQLLNASLPTQTRSLDDVAVPFCEATGEVGGYGMAPLQCGLKVERRLTHDGDVLAARYMPRNPLLIASSSSNSNVYIFDWSRVSLNRYPNDPARPRAPLPPNELSSDPSDEERINYQKRMRVLNAAAVEQDRWDRRTGEGQHVLKLTGGNGASDNLDWSTSADGVLASGSNGTVCVWQIANLSKDDPRTVEPTEVFAVGDGEDDERISGVSFLWSSPQEFVCASTSGSVFYNDIRGRCSSSVFSLACPATCLATHPLDSSALLVGDEEGQVHFFDLRKSIEPVRVETLHSGEVTTVEWCPHSRHLFASGGVDANACVYDSEKQRLLFKHAGHTDRIMDLGWNWQDSCAGQLLTADCNAVMLWRPRAFFYSS